MTSFNEQMLNEIRMKCLEYPTNHPVNRSSNVAFRDLFDPYCAEYKGLDHQGRVEVLREMLQKKIIPSVLPFYKCFMDMFRSYNRQDIADSAPDSMALILDFMLLGVEDA